MAMYRTKEGDVLDAICKKHYGNEDMTINVLQANPGLSNNDPSLPAGLIIELPDIQPVTTGTIKLWD